MNHEAAIIDLLGRIGARLGGSVTVSTEDLKQWPVAAVSALKSQGLLLKNRSARSVVCPGCEQECSMRVHTVTHPNLTAATSFVVCDKRSDINRVTIAAARLALWRCDAKAVCGFVSASLSLAQSSVQLSQEGLMPIGMIRGKKRTQMLCLRVIGYLALVVGADSVPLVDLVSYDNGSFTLDQSLIYQMVDAATTADPRHTPSTTRRDARKLDTQARYSNWQKEYRTLLKKYPGKSQVWYSQKIAKTTIAEGKSPGTIKKNMIS